MKSEFTISQLRAIVRSTLAEMKLGLGSRIMHTAEEPEKDRPSYITTKSTVRFDPNEEMKADNRARMSSWPDPEESNRMNDLWNDLYNPEEEILADLDDIEMLPDEPTSSERHRTRAQYNAIVRGEENPPPGWEEFFAKRRG